MVTTLHLAEIPSTPELPSIELRPYQPGDAEAFRTLNEWWIRKHFGIEAHDNDMLLDPEGYVLAQGGHIFFAIADGVPVGCCALIPMEPGIYEVAKMAVDERLQGAGIGRKLLTYTIEQGRLLGAHMLYLETNSKLKNAIHLYESLGFEHLPPRPSPYSRANVFMELRFQ
ncbi:MAG: GNAT family N-acetyltransferase [Edaphobacter sp.]|uniref:GNAT family N-acetyltransferase n=1 Tax=Edaphobacter sp. TaxID=1934404 RepID=UPI00238AF31D|nr:GNAT family N-acetyltransferase [Edaphobacter sp.]MDE1176822.1 GNAT family N-acetyltransferase [Edaphobacter sp.]